MLELVILIIALALVFDFLNGVNDAANSISTVVSTRVLRPRTAVVWAAAFNFVAFLIFGLKVANTVGRGIVSPESNSELTILAGLLGAIFWTALTTKFGMPISVSHSLIGGLVGASITAAGLNSIIFQGFFLTVIFIGLSPTLGLVIGFLLLSFMLRSLARFRPSHLRLDRIFGKLQLASSALYSLGHGSNDAQKTIGVIAVTLFISGVTSEFVIPLWVIFLSYGTIALGTLAGGWRVIRTMGMRLTKLKPIDGFAAETTGAALLFATANAGIPVSTTHTIAGSIIGVGATKGKSAVRWGIARNIVWAWILTIPLSGGVAALAYLALSLVPI